MSRSIHDTRGFLQETLTDDFADPELQQELVRTARSNLRQQRSIKEHTRQHRQRDGLVVPPLDPDRVPILVQDQGPFVHHHATEEDLREVMRRLPPGSLDGLCAIHLCLGEARRPGRQVLPGVYAGPTLGAYMRGDQTIRLFAHVHEGGAPGAAALLLKLRTLAAFVHEGAHHFDCMFRVGRDRWRSDDQDKSEGYTHRRALAQLLRQVLPYVEERYAAECAALAAWLRHHGGVALPLAVLIDHRPGRQAPATRAIAALARAVAAGRAQADTQVELAGALHHAGQDDYALAVVARILTAQPGHPGAWSVRACVAACRGEFALAESTCRDVLRDAPACAAAWAVLSRCHRAQGRWQDLIVSTTQGAALAGPERHWQLQQRARAHLELGCFDDLAEDLALLREQGSAEAERAAAALHAVQLLRQERFAEAFAQAALLLRADPPRSCAAVLAAVRFESAHRLGRPGDAGVLGPRQIARLCAAGYRPWVERLLTAYGAALPGGRIRARPRAR